MIIGFYVKTYYSNDEYKKACIESGTYSERTFLWANDRYNRTSSTVKEFYENYETDDWIPVYSLFTVKGKFWDWVFKAKKK